MDWRKAARPTGAIVALGGNVWTVAEIIMASEGFLASLNFGLPDLVGLGTTFALLAIVAGWPWIRSVEGLWPTGRFFRMTSEIKDAYKAIRSRHPGNRKAAILSLAYKLDKLGIATYPDTSDNPGMGAVVASSFCCGRKSET